MLPEDYRLIVTRGIQALREVEAQLRARAESASESSALWLRVRDVKSLWGWLDSESDWTWQTGFARTFSSPRDLGVLEESLAEAALLPYDEAPAIAALIAFLTRYKRGDFPLEDSSTYPQRSNEPES